MRNLLCSIMLLGMCSSAIAQQYQYISTTAAPAMWQMVTVSAQDDSAAFSRKCNQVNYQFTMHGADTFVNGYYWKKVTMRQHKSTYTTSLSTPCQLPDVSAKVAVYVEAFHALIREDNKMVYEQTFSFPPLFDFNPGPSQMGTVWGHDTVVIDGGLRRRFFTTWVYGGNTIPDTVIEGIGSLRRGLMPIIIPPQAKLTCFQSNGKIIYQNPDYPCSAIFPKGTPTQVSDVAEASIKVYPNPFAASIWISNAPDGTVVIIYNSMGQLVIEAPAATGVIETSSLPAGVYHLLLQSTDGVVIHTQRLVKQ